MDEKTTDQLFEDLYYIESSLEEEKILNEYVDLSIKEKENIHNQIKNLNIAMINRNYIKNKTEFILFIVKDNVIKLKKKVYHLKVRKSF
ncbi:hypothetical protein GVAV_002200 [Gurleya vavrai]